MTSAEAADAILDIFRRGPIVKLAERIVLAADNQAEAQAEQGITFTTAKDDRHAAPR